MLGLRRSEEADNDKGRLQFGDDDDDDETKGQIGTTDEEQAVRRREKGKWWPRLGEWVPGFWAINKGTVKREEHEGDGDDDIDEKRRGRFDGCDAAGDGIGGRIIGSGDVGDTGDADIGMLGFSEG